MKKRKNQILISIIIGIVSLSSVISLTGSNLIKADIDSINQLESDLYEQKETLESIVQEQKDIQGLKEELEQTMDSSRKELESINNSIEELEIQLKENEEKIGAMEEELDKIKEKSEEQYEYMKLRIQYMYENRNSDFLWLFDDATSFSDLLNRVQFVTEIIEYDRNMLNQWNVLQEEIALQSENLEIEKKAQEEKLLNLTNNKNKLNEYIAITVNKIQQYTEKIVQLSASKEAIENEVYDAEVLYNQLIEEALKKEEAINQETEEIEIEEIEIETLEQTIENNNDNHSLYISSSEEAISEVYTEIVEETEPATTQVQSSSSVIEQTTTIEETTSSSVETITEEVNKPAEEIDELMLLAALIECEADSEIYEGKVAVGAIVMNRIKSSKYPDTVKEVIFQTNQFAPVSSGRLMLVLAKGPKESCIQAAKDALNGVNPVEDCLYFRNIASNREGVIIGNHVFF